MTSNLLARDAPALAGPSATPPAGGLIMVDDSVAELVLAEACLDMSRLRLPWLAFTDGPGFLDHMEAVSAGRAACPALVLLDLNMPQQPGFDVLARLRRNPRFADSPPVVVLTNSENPADVRRAEELRAAGYYVKPDSVAGYVELFDSFSRSAAGDP